MRTSSSAGGGPRARARACIVFLLAGLLLVVTTACGSTPVASTSSSARPVSDPAPRTIVSLTFDDGQASQYGAAMMLVTRGMHGTFYVNSGMVGSSPYYMTWWDLQDLYHTGNEIGGHTATHVNLAMVSTAKAKTEVCQDRATLLKRGVGPVTSFAYPYAGIGPADEAIVKSCGYSSARDVGRLRDAECTTCAYSEIMPPADPYRLRTASDSAGWSLKHLRKTVTRVENHGGGWVTLVFHGICKSCTKKESLDPATFRAFLNWLKPRTARGTVVRTVGQVIRDGSRVR